MRGSEGAGRIDGVRGLLSAGLAMLGAVFIALLLWSASAQAALVHPFLGQLTKPKPAKQKDPSPRFSPEVCGISIDPGSGQLYIPDPGAGVAENAKHEEFEEIPSVEIFNSSDEHIRRLDGHNTPEEEFEEFCSTTVNDKSKVLYVADGGGHVIYEFESKAEGKFLKKATIEGTETPAGEFSSELHVAVAQGTGKLYVADGENEAVYVYNEEGKRESQLTFPAGEEEHRPGPVAVDQSTGEVFVAVEGQELGVEETEEFGFIDVFSAAGEFLRQISGRTSGTFPGFGSEDEPLLTGLAVGPEGNLYVSDGPRRAVFEFDSSGAFLGEITGTPGEGEGSPEQRFSEPFGVGVNASGDVYVVDRTSERNTPSSQLPGRVDIFGPSVAGAPTVESTSVSDLAATSATLHAAIDPTGTDTSYHFELGTASCVESPASCIDLPSSAGLDIGAGQAIQNVSAEASGLLANTTYHYRVVLSYGPHGESSAAGAEQVFTTRIEGAGVQLLDGRAWEMVSSPTKKSGAAFEAIPENGGLIEASPDGSALTYIATSPDDPKPEGNRSPTYTQTLARRVAGAGGLEWSSQDLVLPGEGSVGARTGTGKQEYVFFNPDLTLSLVQPLGLTPQAEPPLTTDASEKTLYTRQTENCERPPSSCYEALVTAESDTAHTAFGGKAGAATSGLSFVTATPDLNHVVLSSEVPLTNETTVEKSVNLYEWTGKGPGGESIPRPQQLKLINVLPGNTPAPHSAVGTSFVRRNAISSDGSLIVWNDGLHLYQRDMTTGVTVQVDKPEAGVELVGQEEPRFQAASNNGTRVFFTDEQRLTSTSTASRVAGVPDLYEFNATTGKLTDLTVNPQFGTTGESAAVQGLVIGTSETGTVVYYMANAVLSKAPNGEGETATPGSCTAEPEHGATGAKCNLYRQALNGETWGAPTFVASLSAEDILPFSVSTNNSNLQYISARVSPNGRYIAFMSNRSLTGYDNRDTSPAAHDARDEEVFRYDSGSGEVRCASCDPSGARPAGVFDPGLASQSEEGLGLLVDRRDTWEGKWLAANLPGWTGYEGQTALYQSRYLSDKGRLFFNSVVPLVNADHNAKNDVYEFESEGEGSCAVAGGCVALISSGSSKNESAFLDASTSGDDVFFLTTSALVAADHDGDFDVYDARVCGSEGCIAAQGEAAAPCASAEACRGGGATPVVATPGSLTSSTSGNAGPQTGVLPNKSVKPPAKKLTKAQQLAKALKTCRKIKQKKRRVACEKQAKKKYGAKKKTAKKSAAKHVKGKK
jgi:hypothetical protein